ncbi:hypothetical protein DRE_02815 [Drechslerella stenobrocha 248]|uniref:Uncharacterized protein n=1 Tax=Drechslerella stenobrocha 248 TaxID=1043628 RepID=W7I6Q3_9PEZI|nr:hypothetical protein DRE_02815 [Drechslerella stenobrocha 248]
MVRVKQRYILFNILYPSAPASSLQSMVFCRPSPTNLTRTSLAAAIRASLSHNFGDWGIGQAGSFAVKYFSPATSTGILRITRDNYRLLWATLTFMRELSGQPVVIKVARVSGTIRKAEVEAVKLAEETIRRVRREERAGSGGAAVAALFAGATSKAKAEMGQNAGDSDGEIVVEMDIVDSDGDPE